MPITILPQIDPRSEILDCGHNPSEHSDFTTGYGHTNDGEKHCYYCCAVQDEQWMLEKGKISLYLSEKFEEVRPGLKRYVSATVTNWPGSLKFEVFSRRKGSHNIAGTRYDVWFVGPDSHVWHGVQYGEWTQICHCKRTKEVWEKRAA